MQGSKAKTTNEAASFDGNSAVYTTAQPCRATALASRTCVTITLSYPHAVDRSSVPWRPALR